MSLAKTKASVSEIDPKIADIQRKIQDEDYVNDAIERIALVLSRQVLDSRKMALHSAKLSGQP